jgi:hypothetical protein
MKDEPKTMIAAFYLSEDAKDTLCRLRVLPGLNVDNFAWLAVMLVRHVALRFKLDEDEVWDRVELLRRSEEENPSRIVRTS